MTADGEIRRVDAGSDPELFWAVRGGKANFGIVTEIEFGLVPVTSIVGGSVFFAAESAADVLHAYRTWTATLPDRTTTSIALVRIPDVDGPPEPLRGRVVVHLRFAHNGAVREAKALLAPMLAAGPVVLSAVGPMPCSEADAIHQDPTEPGASWVRGMLLASLGGGDGRRADGRRRSGRADPPRHGGAAASRRRAGAAAGRA